MRFNNKTNIPNKVVQNVVNNLDKVDDLGRDLYTPLCFRCNGDVPCPIGGD